jgi:hypothetical protein
MTNDKLGVEEETSFSSSSFLESTVAKEAPLFRDFGSWSLTIQMQDQTS